jgi:lipid-A-disaccharide synthase
MVNLIAGRTILPELIQENFTAEKVVEQLRPLLADTDEREQMMRDLAEVKQKLRRSDAGDRNAITRTASAVLSAVGVTVASGTLDPAN